MEMISHRIGNDNDDANQLPPPPPYATVVYKLNENEYEGLPPPAYVDVDVQSVTYINNYPGPPLTDGHVQGTREVVPIDQVTNRSKNVVIYLITNGIITILFGIAIVGIEIGIIASDAIVYYYYGFWGGAIIISLGISSILFYKRHYIVDYNKLFRSYIWQIILIGIVFGVGIAIISTDKCNDNDTENDGFNEPCKRSHKILNGFLIGLFAAAFVLSIINTIIFGILNCKRG